MSEEQAVAPAARPRPLERLVLAIPLLLIVAVVVNWRSIQAIARQQKSVGEVLTGRQRATPVVTYSFPAPSGPATAKIKATVVAREGDSCHRSLVALWFGVAQLEPKRIRVEFHRPGLMTKQGGKERPVELGCESGVLINGQNKFVLGTGKDKRTIYLTGPTPMEMPTGAAAPSPSAQVGSGHGAPGHGWSADDVAAILNRLLKGKYGQPGKLTGKAIQEAAGAADKLIPPRNPQGSGVGDQGSGVSGHGPVKRSATS